jgi:hypothetical protein
MESDNEFNPQLLVCFDKFTGMQKLFAGTRLQMHMHKGKSARS